MRKFLLTLIFTSVLLKTNATTVLMTTDPQKELSVKCEGLTKTDELSDVTKHHIAFLLVLRTDLAKENAVSSQKYLDLHLYIAVIDYLNNKLSHEDVTYLKGVQKILSSMPLKIEKTLSSRLKEKFLSLGVNGI
jgi:hypothetical protein